MLIHKYANEFNSHICIIRIHSRIRIVFIIYKKPLDATPLFLIGRYSPSFEIIGYFLFFDKCYSYRGFYAKIEIQGNLFFTKFPKVLNFNRFFGNRKAYLF